MNAKVADRLATGVFYLIAFLIVGILLGFLGVLLYRGLPMIDWHFLTNPPETVRAGGGVGPQLCNSG